MKLVDYIIWFLVIIILAIIILFWQAAYADNSIKTLDIDIAAQKKILEETNNLLKQKKEEYRQVKRTEGKSWDFLPAIKTAQEQIDLVIKQNKEASVEYYKLLKLKSEEIKKIKQLKKELKSEPVYNGTGTRKIILILLSDKCLDMIKNNFTTTCPTYKQLGYLDNSIQKITGYFTNTPYYHRLPPILKDSWRYYDHDNTSRVIIDPIGSMADRYPLIKIESNFDTFLQTDSRSMEQKYIVLNSTRPNDAWGRNGTYRDVQVVNIPVADSRGELVIYHDLFVNSSCKNAIINADKWQILLPLMIEHMQNGCSGSLDNSEIIIKNYTIQDIATTNKFKLDNWINQIKSGNKTINKSVTEDRMPKYIPKVHPPFDYSNGNPQSMQ